MIPITGIYDPGLRPAPRGGFAPATRQKPKAFPRPPAGRDGARWGRRKNEEKLARDTFCALKQHHVLGSASLAGFEVFIEAQPKSTASNEVFRTPAAGVCTWRSNARGAPENREKTMGEGKQTSAIL